MESVAYPERFRKIHRLNYVRNSRAIAVVWAIFTICYAILNIIAFIQPQWIGAAVSSGSSSGFFGLYIYCTRAFGGAEYTCGGTFTDYSTILNDSLRAAAFFVGFSALLFLVCILCFLLFFFLNTVTVLQICGWLQLVGAVFMLLGCIIYPSGWDHEEFASVCQNTGAFDLGNCEIRWAYVLAILLIFDAIILSILAFLMAYKQKTLLPEIYGSKDQKAYISNGYEGDTMSKRSTTHLNIPADQYSQSHYSHRSDKHSEKY